MASRRTVMRDRAAVHSRRLDTDSADAYGTTSRFTRRRAMIRMSVMYRTTPQAHISEVIG
jgi:hypothetical protein